MLSDSKIMHGEGKAIVCAVGENTLLARHRQKDQLVIKEEQTELEMKLEKVSKSVETIAKIAMLFCLVT